MYDLLTDHQEGIDTNERRMIACISHQKETYG